MTTKGKTSSKPAKPRKKKDADTEPKGPAIKETNLEEPPADGAPVVEPFAEPEEPKDAKDEDNVDVPSLAVVGIETPKGGKPGESVGFADSLAPKSNKNRVTIADILARRRRRPGR